MATEAWSALNNSGWWLLVAGAAEGWGCQLQGKLAGWIVLGRSLLTF